MKIHSRILKSLGIFAFVATLIACSSHGDDAPQVVATPNPTGEVGPKGAPVFKPVTPDGKMVDIANYSVPYFVANGSLSQSAYYERESHLAAVSLCAATDSFQFYKVGDSFASSRLRDGSEVGIHSQAEIELTLTAVSAQKVSMSVHYGSMLFEGFSGPALQSNDLIRSCEFKDQKECVSQTHPTAEFERFKQARPDKVADANCALDLQDGTAVQEIFANGSYTLANGRSVPALLVKRQLHATEICGNKPGAKKILTTISVVTDRVKADPADCGPFGTEVYRYSLKQSADYQVLSEEQVIVTAAPAL